MKKILAILIGLAMVMVIPSAMADDTQVISVTLTPNSTAAITCNQTTWSPSCGIGGNESTTGGWGNITNSGTVYVSVAVNASDSTNWTLEAAAGHDQFTLSVDGGDMTAEALDGNTPETFDASLANGATEDFDLTVFMPTSSSTNTAQGFDITFVATIL